MFGIVIDKETGYITQDVVAILEDGTLYNCTLKDDEVVVEYIYEEGNPTGGMGKPRYDFGTRKWIDENPLPPQPEVPSEPNEMEVLLNELSEALLESELRAVKSEVVINETSNYVLDLDERLTNIELKK